MIRKMSWDGRVLMQIAGTDCAPSFVCPSSRKRATPQLTKDSEPEAMGLRNWLCHSTIYSARTRRRANWSCRAETQDEDATGLQNWMEEEPEASAMGVGQMAMYRAAADPETQLRRLEVDRIYSKMQEAALQAQLDALQLEETDITQLEQLGAENWPPRDVVVRCVVSWLDNMMGEEEEPLVSWPPAGIFPTTWSYGTACPTFKDSRYGPAEEDIPRRAVVSGSSWDHPDNALAYECGVLGEEIARQSPMIAAYVLSGFLHEEPLDLRLEADGLTWAHPRNWLAYECGKLGEEMAIDAEYEDWDLIKEEQLDFEGKLLEDGPSVYGCTFGELGECFNGELLDDPEAAPEVVRPTKEELNNMSYQEIRALAKRVSLGRKFGTKDQFIKDLLTSQDGWDLLCTPQAQSDWELL